MSNINGKQRERKASSKREKDKRKKEKEREKERKASKFFGNFTVVKISFGLSPGFLVQSS